MALGSAVHAIPLLSQNKFEHLVKELRWVSSSNSIGAFESK